MGEEGYFNLNLLSGGVEKFGFVSCGCCVICKCLSVRVGGFFLRLY